MKIEQENAVCRALNLPSIPKKQWDGQKSFKTGVAVVNLESGHKAYAVASYNNESDKEPKITKVFTIEPFKDIDIIYIVPDYMEDNVEQMDLDDESKKAAQMLLDEANELENIGVDDEPTLPENEYFFDNITNDEQAAAFIKDFNRRNKIRGKVPTSHDGLVMRLSVIYFEMNKKSKK